MWPAALNEFDTPGLDERQTFVPSVICWIRYYWIKSVNFSNFCQYCLQTSCIDMSDVIL